MDQCKVFGYAKLKPLQRQIIIAVTREKSDVLAVLATGFGKSTCYQMPFLINERKKCVIVISPLISLMNDQVTKLLSLDIEAVALHSEMNAEERKFEKINIINGENKIIYMSPEFCLTQLSFLKNLYSQNRICLIAIDESHCVSSWGSDFRPQYKKLNVLKEIMDVPILALTATATEIVRQDIVDSLGIEEYYEFISSFHRTNLYIECHRKTKEFKQDIENIVDEYRNKQTILYARTRDAVEKTLTILLGLGVKATMYHAGMSKHEKEKSFNDFAQKKKKWIVATVALGMGIDQNIDLVIHYGLPGDIDSYYQEIGRAGRSGNPAKCILFYGSHDMTVNRIMLKDITDEKYKHYCENKIKTMEMFAKTSDCRWKTLLQYFGEEFEPPCNNCDNCNKCANYIEKNKAQQDAIQYPAYVLKMMFLKLNVKYGKSKLIDILMGKKNKNALMHSKSMFYGIGTRYNENMWKEVMEILLLNEYITEITIKSGFGTYIQTTEKLLQWHGKVIPIIKENEGSLNSLNYDDFCVYSRFIAEEYKIPEENEIMRYHRNRIYTQIESLLEEQNI